MGACSSWCKDAGLYSAVDLDEPVIHVSAVLKISDRRNAEILRILNSRLADMKDRLTKEQPDYMAWATHSQSTVAALTLQIRRAAVHDLPPGTFIGLLATDKHFEHKGYGRQLLRGVQAWMSAPEGIVAKVTWPLSLVVPTTGTEYALELLEKTDFKKGWDGKARVLKGKGKAQGEVFLFQWWGTEPHDQ